MPLTLSQILDANDRPIETVPIPEWGGEVCVRALTGDQRDRYDQYQADKRWPDKDENPEAEADWRGLRAMAVAMALCDEHGAPQEATELQVLQLGAKNGKALDRVFDAVKRISGLSADAVETAEKNSPGDPSGSSGSS